MSVNDHTADEEVANTVGGVATSETRHGGYDEAWLGCLEAQVRELRENPPRGRMHSIHVCNGCINGGEHKPQFRSFVSGS